jgi:hypothetical protein
MLTDIAIPHTYKGKKANQPLLFTMHPAPNKVGPHAGKFEILFTRKAETKSVKRSAHVTLSELAELYARGLIEQHRIRLRLTPGAGEVYPDAHPGKYVSPAHIVGSSDFDRMVKRVPTSGVLPANLKSVLLQLGVPL